MECDKHMLAAKALEANQLAGRFKMLTSSHSNRSLQAHNLVAKALPEFSKVTQFISSNLCWLMMPSKSLLIAKSA